MNQFTHLQVRGIPALSLATGSSIPYFLATSLNKAIIVIPKHTRSPPRRVSDNGVCEVSQPVVALDVVDPAVVVFHRVAAEGDHLDSSLCKLPSKALGPAQLCGADWGVVSRVREQDGPAALQSQAKLEAVIKQYQLAGRHTIIHAVELCLYPYLTPGVEVNLAMGGGGAKVRNNVTELNSHFLKHCYQLFKYS